MPKLHELLAVESDLKSRAQQQKSKTVKLFGEGTGRFLGRVIAYRVDEGEDPRPPEITELATTVKSEMAQFEAAYGSWVDVAIQKEVTNQETTATVIVDGHNVFGFPLPAPALLNLESKLADLRAVYAGIPTLDPSERWEWSIPHGNYVSADRITNITKKVTRVLTLAEATEHHPAQAQAYHEDVRIGNRTTTLMSGMVTPGDKRETLIRLDKLIRAVKEARQRANDIEISKVEVAELLFIYLSGADLA